MSWLKTAGRELFGLFVDDVPFTVAILAWLGVAALLLPMTAVPLPWDAPILAAGCLLILIEGVRRTARRDRRGR